MQYLCAFEPQPRSVARFWAKLWHVRVYKIQKWRSPCQWNNNTNGLGKDKIVQQAQFKTNYQSESAYKKKKYIGIYIYIYIYIYTHTHTQNWYSYTENSNITSNIINPNLCQVWWTMPGVKSIQNSSQKNSQHLLQKYKSTLTSVISH